MGQPVDGDAVGVLEEQPNARDEPPACSLKLRDLHIDSRSYLPLRPGRCVSADAAADLAAALALGLASVRAAALAALALVTSAVPVWARAEAAADLAALLARGLASVFPAADAALGPVVSPFLRGMLALR